MSEPEIIKITVYVRCETFAQSLANDIASIAIVCGAVFLNEVTLRSDALNLLLGIMSLLWLVGWASSYGENKRVRGGTVDEVIEKLRPKLTDLVERRS